MTPRGYLILVRVKIRKYNAATANLTKARQGGQKNSAAKWKIWNRAALVEFACFPKSPRSRPKTTILRKSLMGTRCLDSTAYRSDKLSYNQLQKPCCHQIHPLEVLSNVRHNVDSIFSLSCTKVATRINHRRRGTTVPSVYVCLRVGIACVDRHIPRVMYPSMCEIIIRWAQEHERRTI